MILFFLLLTQTLKAAGATPIEIGISGPSAFFGQVSEIAGQNHHCKLDRVKLVPGKFFLAKSRIPPAIKAASRSVKSICWCKNSGDTCATFTSIGQGRFITDQHVMDSFQGDISQNHDCGWVVAEKNNQSAPINLRIVRTGRWDKDPQGRDHNHSRDICVVEILELRDVPAIRMASNASIRSGTAVYHLGYPAGRLPYVPFDRAANTPLVSKGSITNLTQYNGEGDFIGVNGTSGGPIVNTGGELVGLFWGKEATKRDSEMFDASSLPSVGPPEKSYFIPLQYVQAALN
jgi:hypothetical protein